MTKQTIQEIGAQIEGAAVNKNLRAPTLKTIARYINASDEYTAAVEQETMTGSSFDRSGRRFKLASDAPQRKSSILEIYKNGQSVYTFDTDAMAGVFTNRDVCMWVNARMIQA